MCCVYMYGGSFHISLLCCFVLFGAWTWMNSAISAAAAEGAGVKLKGLLDDDHRPILSLAPFRALRVGVAGRASVALRSS